MQTEEKNKAGRPEKPIDWKLVETMIHAGCTEKSICHRFDIAPNNFIRRFRDKYGKDFIHYVQENKRVGAENILLTQYVKALKGNTQLLIMLGKERCEQGKGEDLTYKAPNEETLLLKDKLAQAEYRILQLEDAIKSQTNSVLQRSDSTI